MSDSRRVVALALLFLNAVAYGFISVAGQFGPLYMQALDWRPLSGITALFAAGLPALVALALFIAIRRRMPITSVAILFAGWFVLALVEAIVIDPVWGIALAINGLVPFLVVLPYIRGGLAHSTATRH